MSQNRDLEAEVDQLRRRLDELENEQQRTKSLIEQFQAGAISRRTFLAAVGGAAGISALASNARAAPSWGSATGQLGTSSEPVNQAYVKDVRAKTAELEQYATASNNWLGSGDVDWQVSRGPLSQTFATTSSTYVNDGTYMKWRGIVWDEFVPADASGVVAVTGFFDDNGDQIDFRLYNPVDNETALERTGVGTAQNKTFVSSYTPTTTSSVVELRPEIRNSDGTTSVEISQTTVALGIQL